MRILAVSVAPIFPNRIQGGSQRILMEVVDALAGAGHDVRLLSPESPESEEPGSGFRTVQGASVEPVLGLRGSFPAPYQTAPHRLTSAWVALDEAADWADRAYLHADAIYMRSALGDLPVIRSLHDFVYEEALLSAFTLPADLTIVPSKYLRDCIEASVGLVTDPGAIRVVPNGIAAPKLPIAPVLPTGVGSRKEDDLILLHPHRLHREKGITESIEIAARVKSLLPDRRVRLLVPALQSGGTSDDAVVGERWIEKIAAAAGATDLIELHEWLSPESMPAYFAAGDVTLCPGSFVEAFGLTPLESVAAGTPAVCSKVGAFREQVRLAGITHFDHGDIAAGAEAVVQAVSGPAANSELVRKASEEIGQTYDLEVMRSSYVEAITGPLLTRISRSERRLRDRSTWNLAPWCYISGEEIYHDYLARFETFSQLSPLLERSDASGIDASSLDESELVELKRARKQGFVVPT